MNYEIGQLTTPDKGAMAYSRVGNAASKREAVNVMRERQGQNRNSRTAAVVGIWCADTGRLITSPHK